MKLCFTAQVNKLSSHVCPLRNIYMFIFFFFLQLQTVLGFYLFLPDLTTLPHSNVVLIIKLSHLQTINTYQDSNRLLERNHFTQFSAPLHKMLGLIH